LMVEGTSFLFALGILSGSIQFSGELIFVLVLSDVLKL
jgi:hypothetical protein